MTEYEQHIKTTTTSHYARTTNGGEKVESWAQQNYAVDSGIQSGYQTGAHSVLSGASGLHDELLGANQLADPYRHYAVVQDQVDSINEHYNATRSQRIRAAMFPETMDDDDDAAQRPTASGADAIPSTQYDYGRSTNVQRLAQPSQMLKTAVANLINFQNDADLALKAIPELIKLLGDRDEVVVSQAATMVQRLTHSESSRHALVRTPDPGEPLVRALVDALSRTRHNADVEKAAAAVLYDMSQHKDGLLAIFRSGGIPALIRMLGSANDSVVFYATTTLHNLLLHQESAKTDVRKYRGIDAMCPLLAEPRHNNSPKFLAILADCLQILCNGHPESKVAVLSCGGTGAVVEILRRHDYEKLLHAAARLLRVLTVEPSNKASIVNAGGIQVLQRHIATPALMHQQPMADTVNARLVKQVLLCLRNLSDQATREENIDETLKVLLHLLVSSSDPEVVACCAGILSNLTCNNQRNKMSICVNQGIPALIQALEMNRDNMEVTEPGLCTLRHLTSRHDYAENAQGQIRQTPNGFAVICRLLATMRPPLLKAALGLIRNLVSLDANVQPLRDLRLATVDGGGQKGVVDMTADALSHSFHALKEAQMAGTAAPAIEGVTMFDLVEVSCGAFHQLAQDAVCRTQMRAKGTLVPIFVQCLSYDSENVQRSACGALHELSTEAEGVQMIEREGANAVLAELMHARNEHTASYAMAILRKLGSDKPEGYQQRLEMQMNSALYRDDSIPWAQDGMNEMLPPDEPFPDTLYHPPGYGMDPHMNVGAWQQQQQHHHQHQHPAPPSASSVAGSYRDGGHTNPAAGGWYDTDL